MIKPSWNDIDTACKALVDKINVDGREFSAVMAIPRGGLIPGVIISHLLDIPLVLNPKYKGNLLLVDDIADSGLTLKTFSTDAPNCTTLTLYKDIHSNFIPDYFYFESGEWIKFPWETDRTSKVDYKEKK